MQARSEEEVIGGQMGQETRFQIRKEDGWWVVYDYGMRTAQALSFKTCLIFLKWFAPAIFGFYYGDRRQISDGWMNG